jgi:hypothetical protein
MVDFCFYPSTGMATNNSWQKPIEGAQIPN